MSATINKNQQRSVKKLAKNPNEVFKGRAGHAVWQIKKAGLAFKDVVAIITVSNDEYNNAQGFQLIQNVWYGRAIDMNLTEILEKIASGELKAA